ncbi:MAG TPA: type IV pilus assembly protein PilM, partial [Longimicrobiales bacterium]|nr:type IV pilus assembly protein PilM [Longimicrobiales bacterium]
MALFGRSKSSVGLDIGSGFVKVIEVDHSGDTPEVTSVAMRPLLPDAIVEGEVMDPGLVADTIEGLFEESGLKPKDVVTAVGGHDVIIKKIEMDRMKESDAREVIRWEAEQHVPFDIRSVELDFQILDPLAEGLQMQVLLVAAKRELVDNKVNLLLDSGVSPGVIDVDAFALHNAFEHNYPSAMSGIVGLVNVGHETTNVNILEDGVPILTRDIPFGSRWIREDLQREKGLTAEQAEDAIQGREEVPDLTR